VSGVWEVEVIRFTVPGDPVAKGRPRVVRVGAGVRGVTPAKTRRYEAIVAECAAMARSAAGGEWPLPASACLRVEVDAVFRRPGGRFRRKDPGGRIPRGRRPDLDNVLKAVLDGIDRAGIWQDDAQVVEVAVRKWDGAIVGERRERRSEPPCCEVRIGLAGGAE